MSLLIFLKWFKTGILLVSLFLLGVSGDCGLNDGVAGVFSKGTNCERLVNLFADEKYRQEKCPEELCNIPLGPKTAKVLFDELLAVFTFSPAPMPLKTPVKMNRYKVNVNKTQDKVVQKVAQDIIEKVLKNEDAAVKEAAVKEEIIGEVALRVGADLTRAFYFVIGADYKRVWDMSRADIQKEFPEIVGVIKDTLTDAEKSKKIESARTKILEKKVKHFETMWEKVDSIEKTIYLEKNRVLILAARERVSKVPKVDEKQEEKDRRAHEKTAKDSRMSH